MKPQSLTDIAEQSDALVLLTDSLLCAFPPTLTMVLVVQDIAVSVPNHKSQLTTVLIVQDVFDGQTESEPINEPRPPPRRWLSVCNSLKFLHFVASLPPAVDILGARRQIRHADVSVHCWTSVAEREIGVSRSAPFRWFLSSVFRRSAARPRPSSLAAPFSL